MTAAAPEAVERKRLYDLAYRQAHRHANACPTCGGLKEKKSAQCHSCAVRRGAASPGFKGDNATVKSKRRRATSLYALGPCEGCGAAGRDRHHRDGDTGNNSSDNIRILCRRCHMAEDGRLAALPHYTDGRRRGPRVSHCRRGHPYDADNMFRWGNGGQRCRTCEAMRLQKRYADRRARILAEGGQVRRAPAPRQNRRFVALCGFEGAL